MLKRCRLNRLSYLDRAISEVVRRYEHDQPGDLLHVDVTKFGKIPDGGGCRFVGRAQGFLNRAKTEGKPPERSRQSALGYCFVHTVVDDHSQLVYAEIHDDEKAVTAAGVLRRATAWFAARNVHIMRVIHDYNHHRPHSASGGQPPVTRLTNLPDQYF